jgi:predicted metalloprotease with PDZ domain
MRALWARGAGGPIDESDIAAALEAVGGRAYADELAAWVHGRGELPLREALEAFGIEWQGTAPTLAQRLGLRVGESALTGIKVTHVLREGAAEAAGFAPGDEVLSLAGWRVRRLDEALRVAEPGDRVEVLVARDQRVQTLQLEWPQAQSTAGAVTLKLAAKPTPEALARQKAWLAG